MLLEAAKDEVDFRSGVIQVISTVCLVSQMPIVNKMLDLTKVICSTRSSILNIPCILKLASSISESRPLDGQARRH
ncbi:MAG: hypothetical protein ACI8S7_002230 [Candidatus Krumholzibacteriia bacterium]|jgi:hypothetical protein